MAWSTSGWHETRGRDGVLEAVCVVAAYVGFGVLWAAIESGAAIDSRAPVDARAREVPAAYPGPLVDPEPRPPSLAPSASTWLVDGFNVLHAGVLRGRDRADWWSAARRADLLSLARRFYDSAAEIWVVFDGPRAGSPPDPAPGGGEPSGVHEVFAPSADDWLVERVRATPDPSRLAVVTADRQVAGRARHRGARVVAPREFLARCCG